MTPMGVCMCYRLKTSSVNLKVELYMNGDQIDPANDRKLVTQLGIRDKTVSENSFAVIIHIVVPIPVSYPVWVPGLRIDPLCLLAGCRKRRLNQAPLSLCGLI